MLPASSPKDRDKLSTSEDLIASSPCCLEIQSGATRKLHDSRKPLDAAKAACTAKESKSEGIEVMFVDVEDRADEGSIANNKNKIHLHKTTYCRFSGFFCLFQSKATLFYR